MSGRKRSNAWLRRQARDPFVKAAKAAGLRSRAALKLQQINTKDEILRPGACIVDLGAAPGGWSQVAAKAVGVQGRVIALDILFMDPIAGVEFIEGDFCEDAVLKELTNCLGESKVDLVLSDMAPNMSGIRSADIARSFGLAELALDFADSYLKAGGDFLVKVFHGADFNDYRSALRERFERVLVRKPEASRDDSSEIYLLSLNFRERETENKIAD